MKHVLINQTGDVRNIRKEKYSKEEINQKEKEYKEKLSQYKLR